MKNIIKKGLYLCLASGAMTLAGCTHDFEDINKNPLLPDAEMLVQDGVLNGSFMPSLQFAPIPAGVSGTDYVNNYQVTNTLCADSWMGYFAPRDAKWPGRNLTQFYFDEGWTNGIFSTAITTVMSPWIQIKKLNYDVDNKNLEVWSIAQITKIMGMHRATDKYGAIPYSGVGSGSFTVAYDSQEDIYTSFFSELKDAIEHLYNYSLTTPIVDRSSDVVYGGDARKWARLGNSLMLRLAMRVRFVAPEMSKQWAEWAMSHPAGLIETVDQIAKIKDGGGLKTKNALFTIAGSYNDLRMGATIQSYLLGYNDPRVKVYFTGKTDVAVPPALPQTGGKYDDAANVNVGEYDATIWFKASETYFLKAEAALAGYNANGGTPKSLYEAGVKMSFEENGLSGADEYLAGTKSPAPFVDKVSPNYSAAAPSKISVAWNDGTSDEEKLERIITQKYLAIFPDGTEAWSEWRRTGYPRVIPANTSISNFGVVPTNGKEDGVRCIPYPQKELDQNTANVQDAINKYRGGANNAVTNVWWDVKNK